MILNSNFYRVTQVGQNWNQIVKELHQWQEFGQALEYEKTAHESA